jgi:predicted glycoside hydrolase/deacetylase ChbG (UPF0249 family)
MKHKKILFHADDYGRSVEISKNILKCLKYGCLNSVSIIINRDTSSHNSLKKLKNINLKLHLNLTELQKSKSSKKKFLKNLSFFKLFFLNNFEKKIIINKINSQIKKFIKIYRPKNLKIDGHEHVHMIPWIFKYLLKQKKKYNIQQLRNSNELLMPPRLKDLISYRYIRNFFACIFVKVLYYYNKEINLNSPQFTGILYSGVQNIDTIKKTLNFYKRKNYENYEILIHPGYTSLKEKTKFKKEYFNFYSSKNRKTEYKLCFLKKIKKELKFNTSIIF